MLLQDSRRAARVGRYLLQAEIAASTLDLTTNEAERRFLEARLD